MRCHSTRIVSWEGLVNFPSGPNSFCKIDFVLVCNPLSFCDTFRSVYMSLGSDHRGGFIILRLYIVRHYVDCRPQS